MPRKNPSKARYEQIRQFCWVRAHKSTSPKWRSFWFNQFEVADQFRYLVA